MQRVVLKVAVVLYVT